jgi:D-tyrosyl-tRNA(Tyr) deacylase
MKAILQRVKRCSIFIEGHKISEIGYGLVVLLGIEKDDMEKEADYLSSKILGLRVFEDENGKMNYSICEIKGEIMVISQFTLLANCRKGNRPSFDSAAHPDVAIRLYNYFIKKISEDSKLSIKTGKFAAKMDVELVNDGPVTIILDSR